MNNPFIDNDNGSLFDQPQDQPQRTWLTGGFDWESAGGARAGQTAGLEASAEQRGEPGIGEELLMSVPRGVESAVQGVYGLADMLAFDALPDYTNEDRIFGTSKTVVGGLSEGLISFMVPFWALGAAGKVGKLGKFGKWLSRDTFASDLVRGGMVDFAAFDANDGRLSDLAVGTEYDNALTTYLKTDKDDSELEGRLKNLAEGGLLGVPLDLLFRAKSISKQYRQLRSAGASAEEAARSVAGIGEEAIDQLISQRLQNLGDQKRVVDGTAVDAEASPFVRKDHDPIAHETLRNEVGATDVEPEYWRGTTNQLLTDTKAADGLVGATKEAVVELVGLIGERAFDTVSINIGGRGAFEVGATASYNYLSRTVRLYSDAIRSGTVRDDIFHEMWHSLEQSLSDKQRTKVVAEFVRQREAYFTKNPEAADRFEELRYAAPEAKQALLQQIVAKGEYQYVSPAEWWATMGTASTKKRLELVSTIKDGGVRGLVAQANIMWSDFTASMRKVFGAQRTDDIINGFYSGRVNAASTSINRLRGLSDTGVETVYARNVFRLTDEEVTGVSEALSKGQAAGLSGIDLAASVPYPKLVDGFNESLNALNPGTMVGKGGMAITQLKFGEGVRGDNIIRGLARLVYGSEKNRTLAESYLKSIGIEATDDAVETLKNLVAQQRKAMADAKAMSAGKVKSKAKSTATQGPAPEDIGATVEEGAGGGKPMSSILMQDVKELGKNLKAAGLSLEEIREQQLDMLINDGGATAANSFVRDLRKRNKIDANTYERMLADVEKRVAAEDAAKNKRTEGQIGQDRTEMTGRSNYIELSKDDVEILLAKLRTATPEMSLEGAGGTFSSTVSTKRVSDMRKTLDESLAKVEELTKAYGSEDARTKRAITKARRDKRALDTALSQAEEGAAEVVSAGAKPTAEMVPSTPVRALEEDPTLAAALEAEATAGKEAAPTVEDEIRTQVMAAEKAKTDADAAYAAANKRINEIMALDGRDRKPFLQELGTLRAELPKLKVAARTAEENLGKLGVQVDMVRKQVAAEAAAKTQAAQATEAAAIKEAIGRQEAQRAAAAAVEPTVEMVEAVSGPITPSLFPSTAPDTVRASPAKVKQRRKVESQVAKVTESLFDDAPAGAAPAEVVATVKEALAENPELVEKLKNGDAGDKIEAIDELADKVEAKAAEVKEAPAAAAPAAPTVDLTSVKQKLDEIEAKYKKEQGKYEKAKNQEAEAKAMNAMDKLAKERDALKQQIADAEAGVAKAEPVPTEVAPVAPAAATPPAAAAAPTAKPEDFTLPRDLRGAKPRYGNEVLEFASDYDKVAYILARDAAGNASKAAPRYRAALEQAGLSVDDAIAHGTTVREAIKAKGVTAVEAPVPTPAAATPAPAATPTPAAAAPAPGAPTTPTPTPAAAAPTPPSTPTPPATPPSTPPTTPSGHPLRPDGTPRRLPEEIGAANVSKPLDRADADDLIWWAENNPATIGPAGVNPRDLNTAEDILQAWLMDRIGTLNLNRMDMDGADASFLRTMERYIAGRDLKRRALTSKKAYTLKSMLEDGLATISDETGTSIEELATKLYARGDDLTDIRAELLHGRLMLHRVNQQVAEELRILSPKLQDGSATHEELLFMLMRVASHGELTGAVNTVSSEAGRLLHSLRAKIDASLTLGYNPKNASTLPTPTPGKPTPTATTPTTTTAPTGTTGGAPAPQSLTPAAAHAGYSVSVRQSLERIRQIHGQDGLENILNKLGGRDHIIITLAKFEEVMKWQLAKGQSPGAMINKQAKAIRTLGFWDFHNEWWINGLLSAGSTWMGVATLSNSVVAMMRPLERIVGGSLRSVVDREGGLEAMRIGFNTYANMTKAMLEMISFAGADTTGGQIKKAVGQTFRQASAVSSPATFDLSVTNAFSRHNLPFVRKMAEEKAAKLGKNTDEVKVGLEWMFDAIRLPQRLVLTGDELFKQIQYRAELHAQIQNSLNKQGIIGPDAVSRAKEAMDFAVLNGEFVTDQRLLKEGQQQALAMGKTGDEVLKFAEDYKRQRWNEASAALGIEDFTTYSKKEMDEAKAKGIDNPKARKALEMMTGNALKYARENTMQADPRFKIQRVISNGVQRVPALRLVLPFVSTPMNSIVFAGDRAPLGMLSVVNEFVKSGVGERWYKTFKEAGAPDWVTDWGRSMESRVAQDLASQDPAVRADVLGRVVVGTAVMGTIYGMAASGNITGYGPRNKDERKTWQQLGNQPYSIKIGDTWTSFSRIDPLGTLFGSVADMTLAAKYSHMDEENMGKVETAFSSIFFALVNNLTNKSYLQGVAQLVDALGQQDPEMGQRALARHFASLIPYSSAMRSVVDMTDPHKRVGDPDFMDNIMASLMNNIPGLSDNNLPARDLFGKPMVRAERLGPDLLSPVTVMPVMNQTLRTEMTNLGRAFKPASFMAEAGIDLRKVKLSNGRNAYDLLQELSGEINLRGQTLEQSLISLVESDAYRRMSPMSTQFVDSPRVLAIRREMSKYRAKAWLTMKQRYPELGEMVRSIEQQKRGARLGNNPTALGIYEN